MNTRKSHFQQKDPFYSPDFEFVIDRRSVPFIGFNDDVHWHDYCELEYICSGQCVHVMNNHRYEMAPGSVYLITPMDFHQVFSSREQPLELFHIQFGCSVLSSELMQRIARTQSLSPHGIAARLSGSTRDTICAGFEQLLQEFNSRKPDAVPMMRSCLERLCMLVLREAEHGIAPPESIPRTGSHAAINQAVQYMRYNFRSPITLNQVADHVHLSNNYFGELFRQRVGMSFNEYLQQCRLDYARHLLTDTELSISEVAWESGFRTSSYFADVFRRRYALSPTDFRQQHAMKGRIDP